MKLSNIRNLFDITPIIPAIFSIIFIFLLWDGGLVITDKPLKISWDAPVENSEYGAPTSYEVKLVTSAKTVVRTYTYTTPTNSIIISRPSSDFFEIRIRAMNAAGAGEWFVSSANDATLNGQSKSWHVFFMLPSVTGGGID